jgi:hypothetical protein
MEDPTESSFGDKDEAILVKVAIEPDIRPAQHIDPLAFAELDRFQALSAAFGLRDIG